jgi:hypothetical protein
LKIGSHHEGTEIIVSIPYSHEADPASTAAASSAL